MKLAHMEHKHGGRITEIKRIAHATERNAPAFWFYEGAVKWDDGTETEHIEIAPWAVCYDHDNAEAVAEYDRLSEQLSAYLSTNGKYNGRQWKPAVKFGHIDLA
jgi:hypothetical protein